MTTQAKQVKKYLEEAEEIYRSSVNSDNLWIENIIEIAKMLQSEYHRRKK